MIPVLSPVALLSLILTPVALRCTPISPHLIALSTKRAKIFEASELNYSTGSRRTRRNRNPLH